MYITLSLYFKRSALYCTSLLYTYTHIHTTYLMPHYTNKSSFYHHYHHYHYCCYCRSDGLNAHTRGLQVISPLLLVVIVPCYPMIMWITHCLSLVQLLLYHSNHGDNNEPNAFVLHRQCSFKGLHGNAWLMAAIRTPFPSRRIILSSLGYLDRPFLRSPITGIKLDNLP